MKFYDDDTGTGRGVISHPTALHSAITQSIDPTGTLVIMTMTPDAGVVIYTALGVGGDFYAPNIYNKTQVDYIASTKQATITSSTHLMLSIFMLWELSQLHLSTQLEP